MAILSISSEYGTGALRIGHAIEAQLGYEYIPLRRLLAEAGQSGRKWKRLAAKYTVDPSDIWEGNDFVAFMALVQSIILGHALRDNVVILARGSNFLLKGVPHALRVRFTAPLEERIAMVVRKEGVNRETARLLVKQADRESDCSLQLAYGPDWDDPTSTRSVSTRADSPWGRSSQSWPRCCGPRRRSRRPGPEIVAEAVCGLSDQGGGAGAPGGDPLEPGGDVRGGGRAAGGGGAQPGGAPEDRAGGAGDRRHGCAALRAGLPDAQTPAGGVEVLRPPRKCLKNRPG